MSNLTKLCLIVVVLVVLQLSCTRLPQKQPVQEGSVATEKLTQTNSIPSDWGKLISVVIPPDSPNLAQLWFQDEKGDIHMAGYNMVQNRLTTNARLFPRK
jgi:hypothetical protein